MTRIAIVASPVESPRVVVWALLLLCLLAAGCGGTSAVVQAIPPTTDTRRAVTVLALEHLGAPFESGAAGPEAFDDSGLVHFAYRGADATLPRGVQAQLDAGKPIELAAARPADLLFFRMKDRDGSDRLRVGLYVRAGEMLMAAPGVQGKSGVQLIALDDSYWRQRMVGVIRRLP